MPSKTVISGVVGLIVGFALGAFVVSQIHTGPTAVERIVSSDTTKDTANRKVAIGQPAGSEQKPPSLPEADAPSEALTAPLESYSGLARSGEHGPLVVAPADFISSLSRAGQVRSLDQPLFSKHSELAAYLQLDEIQTSRLEKEWGRLREQIRDLEKESARFEEKPDGSLEVILPELETGIDTLANGFRASVIQIAGPNRSQVLLAAAQVDEVLASLGAQRKITVKAEPTGDGGWRYQTVVEGPEESKRTYVGENLPASLLHLTGRLQMTDFEESKN